MWVACMRSRGKATELAVSLSCRRRHLLRGECDDGGTVVFLDQTASERRGLQLRVLPNETQKKMSGNFVTKKTIAIFRG